MTWTLATLVVALLVIASASYAQIGISQSSGKPEIKSIACNFIVGKDNAIRASIYNAGEGAGQFAVSVTCPTIRQKGPATLVNIAAKQTSEVSIDVGVGESAIPQQTCAIRAVDQTSFASAELSITCTATQLQSPSPVTPLTPPAPQPTATRTPGFEVGLATAGLLVSFLVFRRK